MKLTEQQALHKLAAYCSKGERCEMEIRKKLQLWEVSPEEALRIVSRLIQEKFLDEKRYAKAFVKDKSLFAKWGKVKIEFELRKKQISEIVVKEAISEIDDRDAQGILFKLLEMKNKSVKAQTDYERRIKLMRYALGKGYQIDVVKRCLDKLLKGGDGYEFVE
jgi:regulatory protein